MEPIRSIWVNYIVKDECPLCHKTGEGVANIWKKGHQRDNGITLETGLSYCESCADTPECEEHWQEWWAGKWEKQKQYCEERYELFGVYTNVAGLNGIPSCYFGYTKTPKGLMPYLLVYPDSPLHKLDKTLDSIRAKQYSGTSKEDVQTEMLQAVEEADIPQAQKDAVSKYLKKI